MPNGENKRRNPRKKKRPAVRANNQKNQVPQNTAAEVSVPGVFSDAEENRGLHALWQNPALLQRIGMESDEAILRAEAQNQTNNRDLANYLNFRADTAKKFKDYHDDIASGKKEKPLHPTRVDATGIHLDAAKLSEFQENSVRHYLGKGSSDTGGSQTCWSASLQVQLNYRGADFRMNEIRA